MWKIELIRLPTPCTKNLVFSRRGTQLKKQQLIRMTEEKTTPGDGSTSSSLQEKEVLMAIGTYTTQKGAKEPGSALPSDGVYFCAINIESGEMRALYSVDVGEDPSWVMFYGERLMFVANEMSPNGKVTSLRRRSPEDGGKFEVVSSVDAAGSDSCYLSAADSGDFVLCANYSSGSVSSLPFDSESGELSSVAGKVQHEGSGPNPDRQEGPHCHCIVPNGGGHAYVCDLGTDQVYSYSVSSTGVMQQYGSLCKLPLGAGPRHLVFHSNKKLAFISEELANNVSSYRVDTLTGDLKETQRVSTLPEDYHGASFAADLRLTPDGRFLYASNRGHNSVAMFSVDSKDGTLNSTGWVETGDWPRSINVTPDGRILVVVGQYSNDLVTFFIDGHTGKLTPTGSSLAVPNPVSIDFSTVNPTGS